MDALEKNYLTNYEVNFKEFLILMELDGIFRRYCNNPAALAGVPLVDLVTNLKRMDLDIVNEERFLKFTLDMLPSSPNQPALYN